MARNSRKRLAKHTLGGAAAIDIRGVEKIDPKVERLVDARQRLTLLEDKVAEMRLELDLLKSGAPSAAGQE